ncbi:MAG: hypothetical protein F4059_06550, partial [Gemmatimonadetes bacterium]|nr:hypothetical protein [Gemmatimonadota bacterium]
RHLHERIGQRTRPLVGTLRGAFQAFFGIMEPWALAHARQGSLRLGRPEGPGTPAGPEPATDPGIGETLGSALIALGDLRRELESLIDRVGGNEDLRTALEGRLLDLRSTGNRLDRIDRALRLCVLGEKGDGEMVRWLEVRASARRRARNLVFSAAPVELGPILAEHLFGNLETALLTSATMAVKGDFGYLKRRLGLEGGEAGDDLEVREAVFGSPFDHGRQSVLIVPTDLPGWSRGGADAFNDATARIVFEVARMSGGGLFALFTSFSALRAVAARLREMGAEEHWPLQVQGEADRSRLLRRFAESGDAVLLGTSSFWEGVDVPGRPLRALLIQKLPFRVPTEPLTEARIETMSARGENPFWGLMVPDAAVRLKQGIGRLIRSRTDRGVVILLDDRLLTRRYGRAIREALPPMPLERGPWEQVRTSVREFYRE